jgi:phosphohistidine phosphatase
MLTLTLIRHAKSSWDDPAATDHARKLNARGRAAAPLIGRWLQDQGHRPGLILCSDAMRTRETLALILPALSPAPQVRYLPELYHADPADMLDLIRTETNPNLALIGHNPGIGALAAMLVQSPPDHPRFADYPTAATTVIRFDAKNWQEIGRGNCAAFTIPADL